MNDGLKTFVNDTKKILKTRIAPIILATFITTNSLEVAKKGLWKKEEMVKVYSKLPKGFTIPTPVGNYNPDWAIVFDEKEVKYIYFIAETKGDLSSLQFRDAEKIKINCAKKLYAALSSENLKYDVITNYEELLGIVKGK